MRMAVQAVRAGGLQAVRATAVGRAGTVKAPGEPGAFCDPKVETLGQALWMLTTGAVVGSSDPPDGSIVTPMTSPL